MVYTSIIEGRQEVELKKEYSRNHGRIPLTGLLQKAHVQLALYTASDHLHRDGPAHRGLGSPTSIIIDLEMLTRLTCRAT